MSSLLDDPLAFPGRYDVYRGGRPGRLDPVIGQKVAAEVEGEALPEPVVALAERYRQSARGKERL